MFNDDSPPEPILPDDQPAQPDDAPRTARIRRRMPETAGQPPAAHTPPDELPDLFSTPASIAPAPNHAGEPLEIFHLLEGDEPYHQQGNAQPLDDLASQLLDKDTPPQKAGKPRQQKQGQKYNGNKQAAAAKKPANQNTTGSSSKKDETVPKKQRFHLPKITFKRVVATLLILLLLGSAVLTGFYFYITRNDDLWLDLDTIPYKTATILYYTDQDTGEPVEYTRLPCTQNKIYIPGEDIPQSLRDAFVAVEDKNFYKHSGFDPKRTLFAVMNEVVHTVTGRYIGGDSGRRQGASTINQQLIKNLTRDDDDSSMAGYLRKIREVFRAVRMDSRYSKDEILNAYLNTISFTGNTAGVEAEAQKLFGKSASQLTIAESASLAAITRNPSRYNPVTNPETHLERRNYVLSLMLEQGYITQVEYDSAVAEPLMLSGNSEPPLEQYVTDYFTDTVIDAAVAELTRQRGLTRREASNLIYNGGLRIYTTVVPQLQANMEKVMENATYHPQPNATVTKPLLGEDGQAVLDEDGKPVMGEVRVTPQAAMISLDYDGGICAITGGLGEKEISRGFNRATSAVRQVGSTMKPIGPYVTALEDGWITWSSSFADEPVMQIENKETGEVTDWPANVNREYSGRNILVHEALARSVNTVAVRVGQEAGTRRMYEFVHNDLGISTIARQDAAPGPLVLGSSTFGITPLDMAKAYAMFGNGGYTVTPHSFTHIASGTGTTLLEVNTPKTRVISEETAYIMNHLLGEVLTSGTAAGWSVPGEMESAGKTGTTSDNRDHWFIGLTPYYVTASWYGYDENISLKVDNRNHPPTLAWRAVMQAGQRGLPVRSFPASNDVIKVDFCTESGYAAGPNCPSAPGYYKRWQPPKNDCPLH